MYWEILLLQYFPDLDFSTGLVFLATTSAKILNTTINKKSMFVASSTCVAVAKQCNLPLSIIFRSIVASMVIGEIISSTLGFSNPKSIATPTSSMSDEL